MTIRFSGDRSASLPGSGGGALLVIIGHYVLADTYSADIDPSLEFIIAAQMLNAETF